MPKEVRLVTRDVEFRAGEAMQGGDGRTLEGYAAVFDSPTEINSWEGTFRESIAPGAFRKTLRERRPIIQYDHGRDVRVGSTPIASLQELREDDEGLFIQARLFDNAVVDPVRQAIEGGAISGMSFRFQVTRDEWRDGSGKLVKPEEIGDLIRSPGDRGPLQRTIRELQLFEAGPVAFPAYSTTSVSVRSALAELPDDDRDRLIAELVEDARQTAVRADDPSDDSGDGKVTYSVVEDHGCGEGKFAVVKSDDQKNESCHPSKELAQAHVKELSGGGDKSEQKAAAPPKDDAKKPYGNVTYADPKNNKYPIDTAAHAKAAWSYINMPKNQADYSPAEVAAIKARIKTALKKFGVDVSEDKKPAEKKSSNLPSGTRRTSGADPHGHPGSSTRKESKMPEITMTVEERIARQEEIRVRLSEIDGEYNGASLPEETQTEWDDLNIEHSEHDEAIAAASLRADQLRRLAVDKPGATERAGARSFNTPTRRRPDNIYDLNEVRSQARSVDEVAVLYRENAMRAVEQAKYGDVDKSQVQGNVERLLNNCDDESGALARRILVTGSPTYERAWGKAVRALSMNGLTSEESRALSLGSDADGGFAVPFQLDPTVILTSDGVINPLRSVARQVQITGKVWEGVTTQGVVVTRSAEATEVPDNSFTLAQPTVNATRVTGFVPFSVELESSWGAMRSEITRLLADAKDQEEAESFINGTGVGTQPFGLVKTMPLASKIPDMGSFGTEDIYALEEAVPPRFRARSQFLGAKGTYNAIRQFGNGLDGADLWVRLGDGRPNTLIGYNALESSEVGAVGASGGYLVFGDFQHFIIVDRIGMTIELVPHLFGGSGRPTGQRGVLAIWSNGSKILVPNAFRLLHAGTT
jgi:HK97 family phage major capsid protein/HK97 family phage prohead protease